jgi:hypothetical protein
LGEWHIAPALHYAHQVFDPDGPGPIPEELYVAGAFQSAGGIATKGIARWNGQRWADVGAASRTGHPR